MTYPFHDGSPEARDAALSACASCGTPRAACFTRADAGGDQCCEGCRHVPDPDTAGTAAIDAELARLRRMEAEVLAGRADPDTAGPEGPMGGGPCFICGADPARGYASTWDPENGERWFCHPDDGPSCYDGSTPPSPPEASPDTGREALADLRTLAALLADTNLTAAATIGACVDRLAAALSRSPSPDTGREALAAIERVRALHRDNGFGWCAGCGVTGMHPYRLDECPTLAALSRSPERATAERCRYCKSALTDEQERRWGICSACHDEGSRG